jgi:hypothetical protein
MREFRILRETSAQTRQRSTSRENDRTLSAQNTAADANKEQRILDQLNDDTKEIHRIESAVSQDIPPLVLDDLKEHTERKNDGDKSTIMLNQSNLTLGNLSMVDTSLVINKSILKSECSLK